MCAVPAPAGGTPGAELLLQKDTGAIRENWLTVAPTWKIIGEVHCG